MSNRTIGVHAATYDRIVLVGHCLVWLNDI